MILSFNCLVGLVARRQRMLGQPRIIRCATKGTVTTYTLRGIGPVAKAKTWEIKVRRGGT